VSIYGFLLYFIKIRDFIVTKHILDVEVSFYKSFSDTTGPVLATHIRAPNEWGVYSDGWNKLFSIQGGTGKVRSKGDISTDGKINASGINTIRDTRKINSSPEDYYVIGQGEYKEFKETDVLNLPVKGGFVHLQTIVNWRDPSGGPIYQYAHHPTGIYMRMSIGTGDWNRAAWKDAKWGPWNNIGGEMNKLCFEGQCINIQEILRSYRDVAVEIPKLIELVKNLPDQQTRVLVKPIANLLRILTEGMDTQDYQDNFVIAILSITKNIINSDIKIKITKRAWSVIIFN